LRDASFEIKFLRNHWNCVHSLHYAVACRGGANGATAPGIRGRGHPKREITKI